MRRVHPVLLAVYVAVPTALLGADARADDAVVQQTPVSQPAPVAQPAPVTQPSTAVQPTAAVPPRSEAVVQQTNVHADGDDDRPSTFSHGFNGLWAGALVGAAGGYLVGRRDDWQREDWRAVGLGIGIGALTGAGLGLSLGLADRGESQATRYIARDMLGGAGFGAVVGAIGGGISAAVNNDAEHVLFGTSIGALAGAGLGIITGIVEGQTRESKTVSVSRLRLRPNLAVTRAVNGSNAFSPGVIGTF